MAMNDQLAVVTGASRGIGRAIAAAFAREGATVACLGRDAMALDETVSSIQSEGGKAVAIVADVTNPEELADAYQQIRGVDRGLDVLVINAGVNLDKATVEESDPDAWMKTIEVNLNGAYHCVRAALPYLKVRGGRIITLGSGTGHQARNSNSSYICSKAALWAFTRVLADELRQYRISANELIPGPVRTDMTDNPADQASVMSIESEWIKSPQDVAPLAVFLASCPPPGPSGQSFSLMRRTG